MLAHVSPKYDNIFSRIRCLLFKRLTAKVRRVFTSPTMFVS